MPLYKKEIHQQKNNKNRLQVKKEKKTLNYQSQVKLL